MSFYPGLMPWHLDGGPACLTFGEIDLFMDRIAEAALRRQLEGS